MLKFHLDEHLPNAVASALRREGIDVTTTPEQRLRGEVDPVQLAFAYRDERVLVTFDADYIRLHRTGSAHAGIAYLTPRSRGIGAIVDNLILLNGVYDPPDMVGRLEYL